MVYSNVFRRRILTSGVPGYRGIWVGGFGSVRSRVMDQKRFDALVTEYGVPGATLAVLDGDEVHALASGVLNADTGVEATTDSMFQLASITKVYTATVFIRLVEEGLATLDTRGIHVFDLATGAERTWDIPVPGSAHRGTLGFLALSAGAANSMLAWAGDHTLAFAYYGGHRRGGASSGTGVRFLNIRAPGTNPLADSRLVVPQPKNSPDLGGYWRAILPTPDGRRVVAVLERTNGRLSQKLVEFSAGTGQVLRVLNHIPVDGTFEQVLWASPSGRSLLVTGTRPASASAGSAYISSPGILTGGRFTPIPWPGQNFSAAW